MMLTIPKTTESKATEQSWSWWPWPVLGHIGVLSSNLVGAWPSCAIPPPCVAQGTPETPDRSNVLRPSGKIY